MCFLHLAGSYSRIYVTCGQNLLFPSVSLFMASLHHLFLCPWCLQFVQLHPFCLSPPPLQCVNAVNTVPLCLTFATCNTPSCSNGMQQEAHERKESLITLFCPCSSLILSFMNVEDQDCAQHTKQNLFNCLLVFPTCCFEQFSVWLAASKVLSGTIHGQGVQACIFPRGTMPNGVCHNSSTSLQASSNGFRPRECTWQKWPTGQFGSQLKASFTFSGACFRLEKLPQSRQQVTKHGWDFDIVNREKKIS